MEEYYFLDSENQRKGPFSLEQLMANSIQPHTLIWKKGLAQWTPAKNVQEVACFFSPADITGNKPSANGTNSKPCPPSNLIWGILTTILCCLPFGIIAIYCSSQVEKHYHQGNYKKAIKYSDRAANWCIASITISVILNLGFFEMFANFTKLALFFSYL